MTSQSLQTFIYLGCYMKFIIQNKLVSLNLLYLSIRMDSCDLWLRWIRKPLLDTMRYWLVYPHEKVTLFFVKCQKHAILAPRLFTFSQCRLVRTITDQVSYVLFQIRVCIVRNPLYVLFPFWSEGKHKAHFLIEKYFRLFYWEGMKQAELTR